ncbi:Uncharacterised protein [Mycobacteroides abscessus subsp. abscessus]|nr:Uncharacterised protein [Mycobacteroides abscessus subsp. abscessus]
MCHCGPHLIGMHPMTHTVGGVEQRERGRCRHRDLRSRAVSRWVLSEQPRIPRVLEFFHANGHDNVVSARCHRIAGVTKRLRPCGTEVLDTSNRLVIAADSTTEGQPAQAGAQRTEPVGIHVVSAQPGDGVNALTVGLQDQIVGGGIPSFSEMAASHGYNGHLAANSVTGHELALPSRSSHEYLRQ